MNDRRIGEIGGVERMKRRGRPRDQITIHVDVVLAELMRRFAETDDRPIGRTWERAAREFLDRRGVEVGESA